MDVDFTPEQELLRESAREFLTAECPIALVRKMMDDPTGRPAELWRQMSELGWLGLIIEEEYGGAGLGLQDLAVLAEEMGRRLLPAPFTSTVALGVTAIREAGSEAQKRAWLPAIAEGKLSIALAQLEGSAGNDWSAQAIGLAADVREDGGLVLNGHKTFARDALAVDRLLVPVRTRTASESHALPEHEAGITLALIPVDSPGIRLEPVAHTDSSRKVCEVHFDKVHIPPKDVLGERDRGWSALDAALDVAKLVMCAESCGGQQAMLDMTVAYAATREQFGQPIGAFQAIQHKCADMLVRLESSRSATYYAAWALDNCEPDAHTAACMAKSFCAEAYTETCGSGIQVHGGLGFTWEQDLHLYYKRAKSDEIFLGDPSWNRELVARQIIDS